MSEDTITISKKQYDYLLKRDDLLEALEQAGVDNWSGYEYAQDILEEWDNE